MRRDSNLPRKRKHYWSVGDSVRFRGKQNIYYKSIEIKNDTIVVSFERANMWISGKNCFESKNFRIAGEDKIFYPAKAWIERSKILVKSDKVPHPVAVRYGFENYVEGDVYCDGLPLGSFRSDDWYIPEYKKD